MNEENGWIKSSLSTIRTHIIIKVKKRGFVIMEKAFEELQIKDDFMFSVIMRKLKKIKKIRNNPIIAYVTSVRNGQSWSIGNDRKS